MRMGTDKPVGNKVSKRTTAAEGSAGDRESYVKVIWRRGDVWKLQCDNKTNGWSDNSDNSMTKKGVGKAWKARMICKWDW